MSLLLFLSQEVVEELSGLHPGPTKAHQEAIDQLRDVGPGAVPVIDPDLIRKALSSFSPTSGAGPSGLRPSHLQEALRHSSIDQTLRLISEVIQLMLRGEVPEDIRQWICGASQRFPLQAHRVPPTGGRGRISPPTLQHGGS